MVNTLRYQTSASVGLYPQRELTGVEYDIISGCSVFTARGFPVSNGTNMLEPDVDFLVDKLWSKMFDKPAIIPCSHCNCHNAFTNSNCVSCGAPMGDSWKWKP